MNKLYQQLNNQPNTGSNILQAFIDFRNNYKGNAKQDVMNLMQRGLLNQSQLNQLQTMANQLQSLIK